MMMADSSVPHNRPEDRVLCASTHASLKDKGINKCCAWDAWLVCGRSRWHRTEDSIMRLGNAEWPFAYHVISRCYHRALAAYGNRPTRNSLGMPRHKADGIDTPRFATPTTGSTREAVVLPYGTRALNRVEQQEWGLPCRSEPIPMRARPSVI